MIFRFQITDAEFCLWEGFLYSLSHLISWCFFVVSGERHEYRNSFTLFFLDEHAEEQGNEIIFPVYFFNVVQC